MTLRCALTLGRRYSASIARAENLLDSSPSYGRFVNDTDTVDGRTDDDFSDSMASPVPSERAMSRAAEPSPQSAGGNAAEGAPRNASKAPLVPPPRRVKTSEDARLGALVARSCGCGAPFRGYSSVFTYVIGGGWLLEAVGANEPAPAQRIRRSMSSRIAVDALQDNDDDEE